MELKLISGRKKTLLEFYDPKRWPEQWGRMPEMMCELIRELEKVQRQPMSAYTSHHELLLTDSEDSRTWRVAVVVKPKDSDWKELLYRVTYALDAPWWHATGYAEDAQSAARLVVEGLDRAVSSKKRNILYNSSMT